MKKKLEKIKQLQRPNKEWDNLKLDKSEFLSKCYLIKENVEKRSENLLSIDEFRMSYEAANRPLVITDTDLNWKAFDKWTFSVRLM